MASEKFVVATATMTSLNPARAIFCLQVNFTGATFEGATVTGNTQFKGSIVKDTGERTTPSKYEAKFAVSLDSELVKTRLSSGTLAMSMRQFVQMLFYRFGCHSPRLQIFGSVNFCKAGYESFIVLSKEPVPCRLHGRWTAKRSEDPPLQDCIWVRAGPSLIFSTIPP
jgi:hypothetical protein